MQEKRISEEDWEEYRLKDDEPCDIEIEKRRALDLVSECIDLYWKSHTSAPYALELETVVCWDDFINEFERDVRSLRKYAIEQLTRERMYLVRARKGMVGIDLKYVNYEITELQDRIDRIKSRLQFHNSLI